MSKITPEQQLRTIAETSQNPAEAVNAQTNLEALAAKRLADAEIRKALAEATPEETEALLAGIKEQPLEPGDLSRGFREVPAEEFLSDEPTIKILRSKGQTGKNEQRSTQ